MTHKRWAELTPAERHEAGIAQDRGDGKDAAYSAKRLQMSIDEVQRILAQQAAGWAAKRSQRIEAQQIQWPRQAPANCCMQCIALWAGGVTLGRKAGVAEPRSIACCHPPHSDGENYAVAFLAPCTPPRWLTFDTVPAPMLNALYADLSSGGWMEISARRDEASAAIREAAARGVATARQLKWAPLIAAAAAAFL